MRRLLALVAVAVLTAGAAAQQDPKDPLADATAAYRKGNFRQAARLFTEAVEREQDPAARANVRVQLAWTYFAMKRRTDARTTLVDALADAPNLELPADYYPADFLKLFAAAKETAASSNLDTAVPESPEMVQGDQGALAQLRQQLALAVDTPAVEAVLASARQLESATSAETLPELLIFEAEVLDRLGRPGQALQTRGRLAAMRAEAAATPGTTVVPFDALLEARRLIATAQPQDAAALMTGVLAELPSCVPALEVLGEAQMESGRLDDAATTLRTALAGNEKPELLMNLGEVEARRGDLDAARAVFRRLVDRDPRNDRALAALGLLAAQMGDEASARHWLDRALDANPTLFEAHVVRAEIALRDDDTAAALEHLRRALQVRPGEPWAEAWFAVARLAAGEATDGPPADGAPATPLFTLARAEAERRSGDPAAALDLAAGSPAPGAKLVEARCLLDLGRAAEAAAVLRPLVVRRPDDGRLLYLLGAAEYAAGAWSEAVSAFERAADLDGAPDDVTTALSRARAAAAAAALMAGADPVTPRPAR